MASRTQLGQGWQPRNPHDMSPITSQQLWDAYSAGVQARQSPAMEDNIVRMLWGVDWQVDFLDPQNGSLLVQGGLDALANFLEYAYDTVHGITKVTSSADDHLPYQIFFPTLWSGLNGEMPEPTGAQGLTEITADDVMQGRWTGVYDPVWQAKYVLKLQDHKKKLVIWPFHCLRGTYGAALAPAWMEFLMFWAGARDAAYNLTPKGSFWGAEMYAPQQALVQHPEDPNAVIVALYDEMEEADEIDAGGVAENFCFDEWANANISEFGQRNSQVLTKFRFNRAFTAPIQFPGYEVGLRAQYQRYAQSGIQIVGSNPYL